MIYPLASRDAARPRLWLLALAASIAGLSIGALSLVSVPATLVIAALPISVWAVATMRGVLARLAMLVTTGIPVFFVGGSLGGSSANPLLSLPLGSAHPPLQVVLPMIMACAAVLWAGRDEMARLRSLLTRGASGVVLLWALGMALLFIYGAFGNGVIASGRDLLYVTMFTWVVIPILIFGQTGEHATRIVLSLVVAAAALSATAALVVFAVPPLRALVLPGTIYTRVSFANESVYPLILPVSFLVLGRRGMGWRAKTFWWLATILMIAALAIGQTRAAIVVAALNILLVSLMPGLRAMHIQRSRMAAMATAMGIALVALLFLASFLGLGAARELPQELSHRLAVIAAYSRVDTFQGRQYTNAVAFRRWLASTDTFLRGEGLGAQLSYYDPVNRRPFDRGPFIDSVWATLAVKGGLVAVGLFAAMLVATLATFVRAARRTTDPLTGVVWRALALSLPGLVVESTVITNHLLAVPAVVVTVCSFVGAADLHALLPPATSTSHGDGPTVSTHHNYRRDTQAR